jgi:Phage integrase, N-terminal SAM-like domain
VGTSPKRKKDRRNGRANGLGSVYKRAEDGKWCASITIGFRDAVRADGTERRDAVRKTVTRPDEASAQAALADLQKMRLHGIDMTKDPTIAEYLHTWLESRIRNGALRNRTVQTYRHSIENYIVPVIGTRTLKNLTTKDVRAMFARLLAGERLTSTGEPGRPLSQSTLGMARSVLSRALKDAVIEELILVNPLDRLARERVSAVAKSRALSDDEGRRLFNAARQHDADAAERGDHTCMAPLVALLTSNMRAGEALAIRWADVASQEQHSPSEVSPRSSLVPWSCSPLCSHWTCSTDSKGCRRDEHPRTELLR